MTNVCGFTHERREQAQQVISLVTNNNYIK